MSVLITISILGLIVLFWIAFIEENLGPKIKNWIHPTTKSKNRVILDKMGQQLYDGKISTTDIFNEIKRQFDEEIKENKKKEQKEKNELRKKKINNLNKNKND